MPTQTLQAPKRILNPAPAIAVAASNAGYHRLTEPREIDGRLRPAGTILDWQGAPQPFLEPLDAAAQARWVAAFPASARRLAGRHSA